MLSVRRGLSTAVLVLLVAAGAVACGKSKKAATSTTAPASGTAPRAGKIEFGAAEYRFDGPSTITGGVVDLTLKNSGTKKHEGFFLRVGDTPQAQALADFAKTNDGGPIPAYAGADGGIGDLAAGATATSTLKLVPGKYLFVCALTDADSEQGPPAGDGAGTSEPAAGGTTAGAGAGGSTTTRAPSTTTKAAPRGATTTTEAKPPPHFSLGMVKPVTVAGDDGRALPSSGPSITAKDYSFDINGLHPGDNTVVFQNTGPAQIHHVVALEFAPGVDEAGARKAFAAFAAAQSQGSEEPPPGVTPPQGVGEIEPFDPGLGGTFSAKLQSGRTYLFACFIQDRTGGAPHAFSHNMVKYLTMQ